MSKKPGRATDCLVLKHSGHLESLRPSIHRGQHLEKVTITSKLFSLLFD